MEDALKLEWHHLDSAAAVEVLRSDATRGLSASEASERSRRYGPNALTGTRKQGPVVRLLQQFHAPLVYVLLAATAATMLLREWVDAAVIFAIVVANAIIGFLQEAKAIAAIETLSRRMANEALAVRDGEPVRVAASSLVPGDVVLLQSGDRVPADVRLLETRELRVDESALTGESVGTHKQPQASARDASLPDRTSMGYASTFVTSGRARALVVATGNATEIGRISSLLESVEQLDTPLTRKIARFSQVLLVAILLLAGAAFAIGMARGLAPFELFMASVALAVGAIPEGLPAAVTVILAIGVARMARRNALIRRLPAVETLGSTTVICSDKTGTLTQNEMTVQCVATVDGRYVVTGSGYDPAGEIEAAEGSPSVHTSIALRECLYAGLACNDAHLRPNDDAAKDGQPRWCIEGDPTEAALLVAASKLGISQAERDEYPRLDTLPFESEHQYMATLHDRGDELAPIAFVKGSVERLLPRCVDALDGKGERVQLEPSAVEHAANEMASRALRVLALARTSRPAGTTTLARSDVEVDLTFLGLQGMLDPPREEAIAAVHACHSAGVDVKMITGDHARTAAAIAANIGIGRDHARVLEGKELEVMGAEELAVQLPSVDVFARVAPEHKLRIVRALQSAGHVVAMTGDGVNDAPALKQADIGIAMGRAGTDVAKEAADMVLTDDDFASIAAAVEEGRCVFDNLQKFIVWTIPTNAGEGLVILASIALGVALPITPLQILWINMTTAGLLGMTLAFEPREPDIMSRGVRAPGRALLTPALLKRTGLVSFLLLGGAFGLFELEMARGASLAVARTVGVNVFVAVEAVYLLSCRSLLESPFARGRGKNPWVWAGIGAMIVIQLLFTYAGPIQRLFGSAPLGTHAWAKVLGVALLAFIVIESEKAVRRRATRVGQTNRSRMRPWKGAASTRLL